MVADAVAVTAAEPGKMSIDVTLEIEGGPVPCRTPRAAINPAAVAMILELGGELPAP